MNDTREAEGNWTYIGQAGTLMIDYIIVNTEAEAFIDTINEGLRTDSDHSGDERGNRNEDIKEDSKEHEDSSEKRLV